MRNSMTKKQVRMLRRIGIAVVVYVCALALPVSYKVHLFLFLAAYGWISYDILWRACKNIRNGQVFDENFLMAVASLGALCLGEFSESVAVILFYQVGEWFQSYAVDRSRQSIAALMDIRPDYATIESDGHVRRVDPYEVSIGDRIIVQPGEKVPLDGTVVDGISALDTSALTGESAPRSVHPDDEIISGYINLNGVLHVRVDKEYDDSTVSKILEMVENASDCKSKSEDFITKFARYYTPIVVYAALALAIVPSLFSGHWSIWIYRALTFLVISCPCALVISVPLSFFGGIGGASRKGILIKGSNYLETLSHVNVMVFDKTGTLTEGTFKVRRIYPVHSTEEQCLEWMAYTEAYSNHPISRSIKEAYGKPIDTTRVKDVEEVAGHGVKARMGAHTFHVGNEKWMASIGVRPDHLGSGLGTMVHMACDGQYAGSLEISDTIKPDTKDAIASLKSNGIQKVSMLTGDSEAVAQAVSQRIGMDTYHAGLLPGDKVDYMEKALAARQENEKLAFVGDGINDAPVLMRADVGIAMGALGSDAAIEAADIVLMDDKPGSIVTALKISRKTLMIVHQNICFAIGIKILILILGALGLAGMWAAVFADVGVAFLCILNAMRCMKI